MRERDWGQAHAPSLMSPAAQGYAAETEAPCWLRTLSGSASWNVLMLKVPTLPAAGRVGRREAQNRTFQRAYLGQAHLRRAGNSCT